MSSEANSIIAEARGAGQPLLLIHGAFEDSRYWAPNVESLSKNYRVLSINLPGAYPDQETSDHTAAEHVEALTDVLRRLPGGAYVLGHSRGGRLALHLAAKCPEEVRGLILAEPGGPMKPSFSSLIEGYGQGNSEWAQEARAGSLTLIEKGEFEAAARYYIDTSQGPGQWAAAPEAFRKIAQDNIATLRWIAGDDTASFSAELLEQVRARTLILVGTKSPPIFDKIAQVLLTRLPHATRREIDGAGHFLSLTHGAEFNETVCRFLAEIEQGCGRTEIG
jgi:pimeloyl-ACP methyl ester carboxylesterase